MTFDLDIYLDQNITSQTEVFMFICSLFEKQYDIFNELKKREQEITTGIGNGIAIPHVKLNNVIPKLVFIRLQHKIYWNALDKMPIDLVFFLLTNKQEPITHLQLLKNLVGLFNSQTTMDILSKSNDTEKIKQLFLEFATHSVSN